MADRPIIFSAPMVRALLEGQKTQTRRIIQQPDMDGGERWVKYPSGWVLSVNAEDEYRRRIPYAPGDRLWVREAFIGPYAYEVNEYPPRDWGNKPIWFPADGPAPEKHAGQFWHRARPSIHMPRWASRLTLTVTDVRVQRLQDISEADAIAEGIVPVTRRFPPLQGCLNQLRERTMYEWSGGWSVRAADAYAALWNSLHGPGAWDANPWVVALTFTVQRGNIDQLPGVAG